MSFEPLDYVRHILAEMEYLREAALELDESAFLRDETRKRAFVRSLEIVGEAAKKVPEAVREQHADIEWRSMAAMRDKLIHDYFGVDYELVWDVVSTNIPVLIPKLQKLLDAE